MNSSIRALVFGAVTSLLGFGVAHSTEMSLPVREIKLDNGLVILVVERKGAPVFSSYIVTAVGSANEKPGSIGAAHFLEHMLFKGTRTIGTKNYKAEQELMDKQDSVWSRIDAARQESRFIRIAKGEKEYQRYLKWISEMEALLDSLIADESLYVVKNEYEALYTRRGGVGFNASTGYDFTDYIVSLPANQLEMWFVMEADRMKNPVLREFYAERNVVLEERRLKIDNEGPGKLYEQFIATAFVAHPYQLMWEWKSDQGNIKREALKQFHKQFYAPNRTVVALVGDVSFAKVKEYAERYWADIPRQVEPDPIYTVEPEQTGERRVEVHFDASASLLIGFHKGAFDDKDEAIFQVLSRLLSDGRSSRLYKTLVLNKQLCLNVSTYFYPGAEQGDLYPNLFIVEVDPKEGVTTTEVEQAVYNELNSLASKPVGKRELQKVKNNIEADFVWSFYSSVGLGRKLAQYQSTAKDWRFMLTRLDEMKAVTSEMIREVAKNYLTENNRTVATLIPIEESNSNKEAGK